MSPLNYSAWEAARALARSGVLALCGRPGGPPAIPPLGAPARLAEITSEIEHMTGGAVQVRWESALAGRAALMGFTRRGRTSANGSCRILRALDGDVALNLARADDIDLLPALTGREVTGREVTAGDAWRDVSTAAASMPAAEFVERARLLGLAAAVPGETGGHSQPFIESRLGERRPARAGWTVVDLSSLWAGPLAARVLAEAGAEVVKVEDPARPDGARAVPAFYSWIHPEKEGAAPVDFRSPGGRGELARLVDSADVVIESSRPRALAQIGLAPEQRGLRPGQVWLSISGYGRSGEPQRDWVGFGDDTAIAGGFTARDDDGILLFAGDAVADPMTGLVAALAALRARREGGGVLIDIPLSRVAAWAALGSGDPKVEGISVEPDGSSGWRLRFGNEVEAVRVRPPDLDWIRPGERSAPR